MEAEVSGGSGREDEGARSINVENYKCVRRTQFVGSVFRRVINRVRERESERWRKREREIEKTSRDGMI